MQSILSQHCNSKSIQEGCILENQYFAVDQTVKLVGLHHFENTRQTQSHIVLYSNHCRLRYSQA